MVDVRPFAGIRPRPDAVADVASPPYDVMDRSEARALLDAHPSSFYRVIRSDALLGDDVDPYGPEAMARAREELASMLGEGLLVRDESPCLYLYEQTMGEHVQLGLVAGASAAEYRDGVIKRHEKTRRAALEGRRRHIESTRANTGLIFLAYRDHAAIEARIQQLASATPDADFVAEDGNRHRLWVLNDPAVCTEIAGLFADVGALYVADGHHRTHASFQVFEKAGDGAGTRGVDHFMAVLFPASQLQILAYNRVVKDLGEHTPASLLAAIARRFSCEPTDEPDAPERGTFGMYLDGAWYRLVPGESVTSQLPPPGDPASVDVAVLQDHLLAPLLGIGDPRADKRIKFVGGIRGAAELKRRVDRDGGVAFTVFPTAMEQVMDVADAGGVMPPKSTWFEPKLRSGLIVRTLD